jgi:lipopolysaccharide transport system permease protein
MSEVACTIYTSESPLRHPGVLFRLMVQDLVNSRELAWRLFIRDVSAQYRQSFLGYIWVFIPPLVASLPFIYLNSQGVVRFGHTPIPYAAYAATGTIVWQAFVDALNAPLRAVLASKAVLTRINLAKEAILLSALAQVVLGVLVRMPLLIGVMALFRIAPPATALLFPIGLMSLILFGFVIGVVLTPLGVLYGDVQQVLPVATTFLMLLTPVVYPAPHSGLAAKVAAFNPLTPLISATRDWLTVGTSSHTGAFIAITLGALLCLLAGWVALRVAMPHVVARIGA